MFNTKKPDKISVVPDATVKNKGGKEERPDLLNSLIGILLSSWNSIIAITADVEAMFPQLRVKISDCNSLQVLWADTPEEKSKVETYNMLEHIFGVTDSPCCQNFQSKQ